MNDPPDPPLEKGGADGNRQLLVGINWQIADPFFSVDSASAICPQCETLKKKRFKVL